MNVHLQRLPYAMAPMDIFPYNEGDVDQKGQASQEKD
jgi:hypothetical protein